MAEFQKGDIVNYQGFGACAHPVDVSISSDGVQEVAYKIRVPDEFFRPKVLEFMHEMDEQTGNRPVDAASRRGSGKFTVGFAGVDWSKSNWQPKGPGAKNPQNN